MFDKEVNSELEGERFYFFNPFTYNATHEIQARIYITE